MYVFKYIVAIKELYYQLKLMYLFLRHVVNKPKTPILRFKEILKDVSCSSTQGFTSLSN
jgi:hypothetical protein